jgi:diguanylate cyclase (GGDEF)-like protein/PAS domain S-box-containing protein
MALDEMAVGASVARIIAASRAERDAVVAHSNDLVMYFESDGLIAWASPAALDLFGMEPDELIGRNGLDMIHPDDQDRVFADFAGITAFGQHVRVEFRVIGDDGVVHWIEETATNWLDDQHVGYIVGNLRDITARKRDEAAISLQGRVLDAAGQAIVVMDMEGAITYWNAAATTTYGWSVDEALGRPAFEILSPVGGWDDHVHELMAAVDAGRSWSGDLMVRRKDGVEIPILATNTPVYDDAGVRIGTIGVSSDITERKRHELEQAQLSAVVASSTDAIFSARLDGLILSWNHGAEELYGYSAPEMIGGSAWITVPEGLRDEMCARMATVAAGHPVTGLETRRRRKDGSEVDVSIAISPMRDGAGEVFGQSVIIRDITENVALRTQVDVDRRRLADAQRIAHVGSFEIDFARGSVTWSEELHAILGLPLDTPATPESFRSCIHPDDRAMFEERLAAAMQGEPEVECTHRIVRPDGQVRWVMIRTAPPSDRGSARVVGTLLDITDRKQLELELSYLATHDTLTGLPNRRFLLHRLEALLALSEPDAGDVGVLLINVDRFKLVNDSLGHDRGDQLLIAIADAIGALVSDNETVARFGGDTYAVVTPNLAEPNRALIRARDIQSRLSEGLVVGSERYTPTISVGMVVARRGDVALTVLRDADTAMYRAKDRGRNRAEWFDPALHHEVVASFAVERELRTAIDADQLHLVFQPVLDLARNRISSCEALVRWRHPTRGLIGPDEFVPVAESSGLIVPLGAWVLREALATVAFWPEAVQVAVNISPRQLAEPDLFALVRDSLDEFDAPASRLVLEVTETAVVQDPTAAARTISALRSLGVEVVIDDFGTGYTSLSFLRDYQLDGLKIDRSFVTDLDHGSAAIVDAILRMAGALGLRVIAEGIETSAQLETLRSLGCRYIQGYLVSRPIDAADLPFMRSGTTDRTSLDASPA